MAVIAACGVPVSLATDADGTSHSANPGVGSYTDSVAAMGRLVAGELKVKLDTEVSFEFHDLYARDLVGRSAALSRLVKAKMPLDQARAVCGL